jgi:hypothetical protein
MGTRGRQNLKAVGRPHRFLSVVRHGASAGAAADDDVQIATAIGGPTEEAARKLMGEPHNPALAPTAGAAETLNCFPGVQSQLIGGGRNGEFG